MKLKWSEYTIDKHIAIAGDNSVYTIQKIDESFYAELEEWLYPDSRSSILVNFHPFNSLEEAKEYCQECTDNIKFKNTAKNKPKV